MTSVSPRYSLGMDDLFDDLGHLIACLAAEFLSIFLLLLFGVASCYFPNKVAISFTFGLIVFALVMTMGHISGCHINPTVTIAFVVLKRITICRALLYILFQLAGGAAGAAACVSLLPSNGTYGHTFLHNDIAIWQGVLMEFFLGFMLVFVILGVTDAYKPEVKPTAAFAIAMTIVFGCFAFMDFTGASFNPARSFATALVFNEWENHWVYWLGPILGGIVAAILYVNCFDAALFKEPDGKES